MHGTANPVFGSSILPSASSFFRNPSLRAFLLLFLCFLATLPAAAQADELYYVELGKAASTREAEAQWQELLDAHTALLGELQYFPRSIIHGGSTRSVHLYAGPIEDKSEAQRLCNRLFREQVACFIVEGLPAAYKTALREPEPENAPLPWLSANSAQPNPWVATPLPAPAAAPAKIHVAEAIRVPLSEMEPAAGTRAEAPKPAANGWLLVSSFEEDAAAIALWREMRRADAAGTEGLRAIVGKSPVDAALRVLRIGPFSEESAAAALCSDTVKAIDGTLACEYRLATRADTAPAPRRDAQPQRLPFKQASPSLYWVRLGSAASDAEAQTRWERLSAQYPDILPATAYQITPSRDGQRFQLRAGPFSTREEATASCYRLTRDGVRCQVMGGL
jgi:cell division septation protein DedD